MQPHARRKSKAGYSKMEIEQNPFLHLYKGALERWRDGHTTSTIMGQWDVELDVETWAMSSRRCSELSRLQRS